MVCGTSTARARALVLAIRVALGSAALAACASPPTQLVVVVDTDLALGAEVDAIEVRVDGPSGITAGSEETELAPGDRERLPLTVGVSPSGDSLGPIDVVATARLDGARVVERRHRVTLVRGETRVLILHLTAACAARDAPCREGETCGENGCVDVEIAAGELPGWSGTAPRLGDDAGAPVRDAGPPDGATIDDGGSNPCEGPDDCDDANPCTDDACTASGCAHTPNRAACDDGVFCNGLDACAGGACSDHAGPPCAGATVCDEAADRCTGCSADADCPAVMTGAWSACAFGGTCAESGTQTRTVRSFACDAGACVPSDRTETQACARATEGNPCASRSCGAWGACSDFSDVCDQSGTERRDCTIGTCHAGACATSTESETRACSRSTDGTVCAPGGCGSWGTCGGFADTCATGGTQSRTCTDDATCSGGTCASPGTHTEMRGCSRGSTDGTACGAPSCGPWGACTAADPCATSGTQSRTCSDPVCAGGTCGGSSPRTQMQACTRSTDGNICEDGDPHSCDDACWGGSCYGSSDCFSPCYCVGRTCRMGGGFCPL